MKLGATLSYIGSLVFISLGFYKMLVYENSDSYLFKSKNAYVGGDAYNYIINSNYTIAYFALAIFCAIVGMTFIIAYKLSNLSIRTSVRDDDLELLND